ncbi:MAG TPA: AtpZ/AtpI family protein [Anaerolineales bacterium]|nr:AtpZ/AtpI family protein [Anaerolineales bacterium]
MSEKDGRKQDRGQYALNMTLAAVAGQVGCLTLGIIIVTLLGGLWLDNALGTKPLITVLLLIGSIPVTIILMFWVVRKATAHMTPAQTDIDAIKEETDLE